MKPWRILFAVWSLSFLIPVVAAASVFGPVEYRRSTGPPDQFVATFQACGGPARHVLIVRAAPAEPGAKIGPAWVRLNGAEIIGPHDLVGPDAQVEKPVSLATANRLDLRLAGGPGRAIAIAIECRANCFGIRTEPAVVDAAGALVHGRVEGSPGEVGVVIDGIRAAVAADRFAAWIPLAPGSTTVNVTATAACGEQIERRIAVTRPQEPSGALFSIHPATGGAPLVVTLEAPVPPGGAMRYAWDLDGDGAIDTAGPDLAAVSTQYAMPGLYFPRLTVTDDAGRAWFWTAVVDVFDPAELDARLQARWNSLRAALAAGDAEAAAAQFVSHARDLYRRNFELMRDRLPQLAQDLPPPRLVRWVEGGAFYEMQASQGGQDLSFHVEFAQDEDGIWRIRYL